MAKSIKTNQGKHWTWREKRQRNKRLYEYWLKHQDWSNKAIAGIFHLDEERVRVILNEMRTLNKDKAQPDGTEITQRNRDSEWEIKANNKCRKASISS